MRPPAASGPARHPDTPVVRVMHLHTADETFGQIAAAGLPDEEVRRAIHMVDHAEHKRQQAPPVLKVTSKAFGAGRRVPIAQRYVPMGEP